MCIHSPIRVCDVQRLCIIIWTGEPEKGATEKVANRVKLREQYFISKGKDIACYLHPEDEGKSTDLEQALDRLFSDLSESLFPFAEFHGGNICCARYANGSWTLKHVDGVGKTDFIKYCDCSKFLMSKKLLRPFAIGISRLGEVELETMKKWSRRKLRKFKVLKNNF